MLSGVALLPVSSAAVDTNPHLTPDGLHLYFESDRVAHPAIYVASRRTIADTFSDAVRIKELSGAQGADGEPWVAPNGRAIYFTSSRNGLAHLFTATRTSF